MADLTDRKFKEIVVEYLSYNPYEPENKGKPYFSIKYVVDGQEFTGYGTYDPETLSEYLRDYFIPAAEPKIIRCGDCKYSSSNHVYGCRLQSFKANDMNVRMYSNDWCSKAIKRDDKDDESGWISCDLALPKTTEQVIVSIHDDFRDYVSSGWYAAEGRLWIVDNKPNTHVTAWQPMLKCYREED